MEGDSPRAFLDQATAAEKRGDIDRALQALVDGFERLLAQDSPVAALPVGWPQADALCARIGARLADFPENGWADRDVCIATQVYAGGGHTAVIGDLVRFSASADHVVLLTQTVERGIHKNDRPSAEIIDRMGIAGDRLRICPATTPSGILGWLLGELKALRPRRVFLFHHPQDAPAVAAAQPGSAAAWYLVHHSDRKPSAGLHVPQIRIADLTPFAASFTRQLLGLIPAYLPLTVPDACPAQRPPFLSGKGGNLTTVASGAAHKFGPEYPEIVADILRLTGGTHHHIGKLGKQPLAAISDAIGAAGIAPARFTYTPWVPSLARALHEIGADVSIGSMPMGGARTAIESCAAGTPMLAHHPKSSTRFGVTHVLPDAFPVWRTKAELLEQLRAIDLGWLERMGRIAREFYETRHHPDILRKALSDIDHGGALWDDPRSDRPRSDFLPVPNVAESLSEGWDSVRQSFSVPS